MGKNYAGKYDKEKMAVAVGQSLPVSTKHCIEICSLIRGKRLDRAKKLMEDAINMKTPIPFKQFNKNVGHRKGNFSAGRFPEKACSEVLTILKSVEANAQFKGLNTNSLVVCHVCANLGSRPWHAGRKRRRRTKRTNFEVMVMEVNQPKDKTKSNKTNADKEKQKPAKDKTQKEEKDNNKNQTKKANEEK
ncbi:MAG: 50S ribosomal protein L22 [Nanoarchaeota archaeon]|nr:50S ribosomal protein L22 [Nanoarchaeota archaeon]